MLVTVHDARSWDEVVAFERSNCASHAVGVFACLALS